MGEVYLNLAKQGRNEWWRYLLSWTVIILLYFGASIVLIFAFFIPILLQGRSIQALTDLPPLQILLASLIPFAFALGGLWISVVLIHKRPFRSLITPRSHFDGKRFAVSFIAWFLLAAASGVVEAALFPGRYQWAFKPAEFFKFLPFLLILFPIQTCTEELVFRGFLQQQLGQITRRPWIVALVSSFIFLLLHLANPELSNGFILTASVYFGLGLLMAFITLKDNQLELALGLHTANNLYVALFVNTTDSAVSTPAFFNVQEFDPLFNLISFLIIGAIYLLILWGFKKFVTDRHSDDDPALKPL